MRQENGSGLAGDHGVVLVAVEGLVQTVTQEVDSVRELAALAVEAGEVDLGQAIGGREGMQEADLDRLEAGLLAAEAQRVGMERAQVRGVAPEVAGGDA